MFEHLTKKDIYLSASLLKKNRENVLETIRKFNQFDSHTKEKYGTEDGILREYWSELSKVSNKEKEFLKDIFKQYDQKAFGKNSEIIKEIYGEY